MCENELRWWVYRVEQRDADVLHDAVQSHELENAEWRDERGSALSLGRARKIRDRVRIKRLGVQLPGYSPVGCRQKRCQGVSESCYLMRLGTQEMLGVEEVKGEATDASSSDREMPLWARFRACHTGRTTSARADFTYSNHQLWLFKSVVNISHNDSSNTEFYKWWILYWGGIFSDSSVWSLVYIFIAFLEVKVDLYYPELYAWWTLFEKV